MEGLFVYSLYLPTTTHGVRSSYTFGGYAATTKAL